MPENNRLNGRLNEIELEFVEREATPQFLMKLSIQLHSAGIVSSVIPCSNLQHRTAL